MAKVFLSDGETYSISDDSDVFGGAGNETIQILPAAEGSTITVHATVERVEFPFNLADYTFVVTGNVVTVTDPAGSVVTITVNGDETWAFADGSAPVVITGMNEIALNGVDIPTVPGPVDTVLDAGDPSANPDPDAGEVLPGESFDLTPGIDGPPEFDFSEHTVADTVYGVQAASIDDGTTLNHGDRILGNGHTIVDLSVIDGPAGGYVAQIKDVAEINISGLTDATTISGDAAVTLQASGFENIGSINMNDGVNGAALFVDNLDLGTTISVSDVTGFLSASFDLPDVEAFAWVENNDIGGDGASALLDTDGSISLELADSARASAGYWDGPIEVGAVSVAAGNDTWSEVWLSASGTTSDDLTAGDVDVSIGNDSTFTLYADASEDVTIGDVTMVGGDNAQLNYDVADAGGNVSLGDISMTVGDPSIISVDVSASGDVTVGNATLLALSGANIDFAVTGDGDVTVGNVTVTAGDDSTVDVTASGSSDIAVGNVDIAAGDDSTVDISVSAWDTGHAVAVGDIDILVGNASSVEVDVLNDNTVEWVGGVTVGNVDIAAGDDSDVNFYLHSYASGTAGTATDAATLDVGNVLVGDVTLEVGNEISYSSTAAATISISSEATTDDTVVGDMTLGNLTVTVGDGLVTVTATTTARDGSDHDKRGLRLYQHRPLSLFGHHRHPRHRRCRRRAGQPDDRRHHHERRQFRHPFPLRGPYGFLHRQCG